MNVATICIDLGASYTKIGFRPACEPTKGHPFNHEADVFNLGERAIIPSLAIRTKDKRTPWLFGHEASEVRPVSGMVVYTNWKAGLYRPNNDAESAQSAVVAKSFFEWLKSKLDPYIADWDYIRVRVTLPAFVDANKLTAIVGKCLELAGWRPSILEFTTEPHANAIGLMTLGRNHVTAGKEGVFPDFLKMLGYSNPYIAKARAVALTDSQNKTYRIAVIDIGAFTTDFAKLEFDVASSSANADGLTAIEQESFTVGTHDNFDLLFWEEMEKARGAFLKRLTYSECEAMKKSILAGKEIAVVIDGKRTVFGNKADGDIALRCAKLFANAIWSQIRSAFNSTETDVVYLTGGGSQIAPVVAEIRKLVKNLSEQPKISMLPSTKTTTGWIRWRTADVDIGRLATAIGGVSVLSPGELGSVRIGMSRKLPRGKASAANTDKTLRQCTCSGNPDCPRCSGSGYILSS